MGLSEIFISEISQIREKERHILCNIYMWNLKIQQTMECKWPRLAHEAPGVSSGGMGQWWPAAVLGALIAAVRARALLKEVTITSTIVWTQAKLQGGEHSPIHQQIIGLKTYWALTCPLGQDLDFPRASPSHQEASTSLLSSSIRGQTEWKAQSQKTNQTYHMDHSHD